MGRINSFLKDTSGNVTIFFIAACVAILGAVGLAMDTSVLNSEKAKLQAAADAGVLAGASIAMVQTDSERQETVLRAYESNNPDVNLMALDGYPIIDFDDVDGEVTIITRSAPKLVLMGMFTGKRTKTVEVRSSAAYSVGDQRPLAIALVLDVSGSMGWNTSDGRVKIDVLKDATHQLIDTIETATLLPNGQRIDVKSGMTTYNSSIVTSTALQPGFAHLEPMIDAMRAGGGTSSTAALDAGLDLLLNNPDRVAGETRDYLIFMTDGDNNRAEDDPLSEDICIKARENEITVYSVAFAAPSRGKNMLLRCASTETDPAQEANRSDVARDWRRWRRNSENNNGSRWSRRHRYRRIDRNASQCSRNIEGILGLLKKCEEEKEGYYYDASNAVDFEEAFKEISDSISEQAVKLNY